MLRIVEIVTSDALLHTLSLLYDRDGTRLANCTLTGDTQRPIRDIDIGSRFSPRKNRHSETEIKFITIYNHFPNHKLSQIFFFFFFQGKICTFDCFELLEKVDSFSGGNKKGGKKSLAGP